MRPPLPAHLKSAPYDVMIGPHEDGRTDVSLESMSLAESFRRLSWAYIGVYANATNIAKIPLVVMRTVDGKAERVDPSHPLQKLLDSPDKKVTSYRLKESAGAFLDLTGNAYWLLDGGNAPKGGKPAAIVPLPSNNVRPIKDRDIGVRGYEFSGPGGVRKFTADEVLHFSTFSPFNLLLGQSSLEAAQIAILTDLYAAIFNKNFFRNGPTMSGVIEFMDQIDDDVAARYMRMFTKRHAGSGNEWKVGVVGGAAEFKPIEQKHTDMMFPQLRDMNREEILGCLGVTPVVVGLSKQVNFATADAERKIYLENTVMPRLELITGPLNQELAPRYGDDISVVADYSGIDALKADLKVLAEVCDIMWSAGALTANEFRATMQAREFPVFAPLPTGDTPMLPFSVLPAGETQTQSAKSSSAGADHPAEKDAVEKLLDGINAAATEMQSSAKAELVRVAQWRSFDKRVRRFGRVFQARANAMFRDQRAAVLDDLEDLLAKMFPADVVVQLHAAVDAVGEEEFHRWIEAVTTGEDDGSEYPEAISGVKAIVVRGVNEVLAVIDAELAKNTNEFRAVYAETILDAGNGALKALELDSKFSMVAPGVTDFLATEAAQLVVGVNETTKRRIAATLTEGVADGENLASLSKRIRSVFDASPARARTIGRTESIKGYNFGTLEGYSQSDVVDDKEWLATKDEVVRDTHAEVDGTVVGLQQNFQVGSSTLRYPGDPAGDAEEVVNCRCTILPKIKQGASFNPAMNGHRTEASCP